MAIVQQKAARAADVVNSIGINTHIGSTDTSYGNFAAVESQLEYIGVKNVRDAVPYAAVVPLYQKLGSVDGIKFDVVVESNISVSMALIDQVAQYVNFVEGPNEVNLVPVKYKGLTGSPAAIQFQKDLYTAVRTDSKLAAAKVIALSMSPGGDYTSLGNLSAYADYGNSHAYAQYGVPPGWMLPGSIAGVVDTPGRPTIVTESGYWTSIDHAGGLNQDVQAKWTVDIILDDFLNGVPKTYLYQLEDAVSDPSNTDWQSHWGLYNYDGTAKTSAVALHNLTTILADTGANAATFTPGTLGYSVAGLPYYALQNLFAKSNGSFDIALWSEPNLWNPTTLTERAITPSALTVSFDKSYALINVYDLITGGTTPIASYRNVSSIQLSLGTDPLIIEVVPTTYNQINATAGGVFTSTGKDLVTAGAGAATVNASGAATIVGGSGTLAVNLNGSAESVVGGAGALAVVDGKGGNSITGGSGMMAVTLKGGNDIVSTGSGTAVIGIWAGDDTVNANGPTTIVAGSGSLTVNAKGDLYVMGAAGPMTINAAGDPGTVSVFTQPNTANLIRLSDGTAGVSSHGADTIYAGAGADNIVLAASATVYGGSGPLKVLSRDAPVSVVGATGSANITLGLGGGFAQGGSSGMNRLLTSGGNATLIGGGDGDVLTDSSTAGKVLLKAGSGAETLVSGAGSDTLVGGSGYNMFTFTKGAGGATDLVQNFNTAVDDLHFVGYGSQAIKSQSVISGSLNLKLTDGNVIILDKVTSLPATAIV